MIVCPLARIAAWLGREDLPDRAAVRRALDSVLARREFQPHVETWFERLKRWAVENLLEGFRHLFRWIDPTTTAGKWIIVALVIVLLLLVAHIVWSALRRQEGLDGKGGRVRRPARSGDAAAGAGERDLLAQARAAAAEGRLLEAMHALYQGTLRWLDARTLVRYDEGKTGGDYARELAAADQRRAFRGLLDAFYPVAFGGRPAALPAFERMHAAARTLGVPA